MKQGWVQPGPTIRAIQAAVLPRIDINFVYGCGFQYAQGRLIDVDFSRGEEEIKAETQQDVEGDADVVRSKTQCLRLVPVSLRLKFLGQGRRGLGRAKGPPRFRARNFRELGEMFSAVNFLRSKYRRQDSFTTRFFCFRSRNRSNSDWNV